MKKFAILALAAVMVIALTVPAAALENEFGGYWRTRMYTEGHFDGENADDENNRLVDTRTRLYYTAKINDNLKLVNKFEMDAVWGGQDNRNLDNRLDPTLGAFGVNRSYNTSYGDIGADGIAVEVKNSYADFNVGPVNFTVGAQPYALFREFHISDDASGIIARYKVLDNFVLAGSWLKVYEGGSGTGNNEDIDAYTLTGAFWFSENISIKPSISYATSSEVATGAGLLLIGAAGGAGASAAAPPFGEANVYTYGLDFDASFDAFGVWATAYMQSGDVETAAGDVDFKGWLAAVGGNVALGPVDLHGQFFYTPGDDDATDRDIDNIWSPSGSYYWSEIMGYGTFDRSSSAGSPADKIFNIWAVNVGTTFKPMDKLKVDVDLWYAEREEDIVFAPGVSEGELGTELDVKVRYQLVEGLNLDLIGAYLWAGDATSGDGDNDDDPYEFGAQLSLSF
jgi:hypothetical protein